MRERQRAATPLGPRWWRRARDRRRGETRQARANARCVLVRGVIAGLEKTPTTKVLRHPVARPLEHRSHVACRQVRERVKLEPPLSAFAVRLVLKDTVEEHRVHVGVELQVRRRPLHRDYRPAPSRRLALGRSRAPS